MTFNSHLMNSDYIFGFISLLLIRFFYNVQTTDNCFPALFFISMKSSWILADCLLWILDIMLPWILLKILN